MKNKLKISCLICLAIISTLTVASCTLKNGGEKVSYTLYDPREESGFVKGGFEERYLTGIDYSSESSPFYVAYKMPESVSIDSQFIDVTLYYGYSAYSSQHGSKTLENLEIGHVSVICGTNQDSYCLEECIPYDEFKTYYVLAEEAGAYDDPEIPDAQVRLIKLTYSYSKSYRVPLTLFKNEGGLLSFSVQSNKYTMVNGMGFVEFGYQKDQEKISILTSLEYANVSTKLLPADKLYTKQDSSSDNSSADRFADLPEYKKPDFKEENGFIKTGFWDVHGYDVLSSAYSDPEHHIACKAPLETNKDQQSIPVELFYGYYAEHDPQYDYEDNFSENNTYPYSVTIYYSHPDRLMLEKEITTDEFSKCTLRKEATPYRYSDTVIGDTGVKLYSYTFDSSLILDIPMPESDSGYIKLCLGLRLPSSDDRSTDILLDSVIFFYEKTETQIIFYTYGEQPS